MGAETNSKHRAFRKLMCLSLFVNDPQELRFEVSLEGYVVRRLDPHVLDHLVRVQNPWD